VQPARDFGQFFAERFCVKVGMHFQDLLFPFAQEFALAVSMLLDESTSRQS
jgi:hypothetical protein